VRPGGVIVQLGLGGGDMSIPMQMVTAKELQLRGSFRFHEEFAIAVDYIDKGMIDVKPLISATLPLTQARDAFELANDRSKSMKVQLAFQRAPNGMRPYFVFCSQAFGTCEDGISPSLQLPNLTCIVASV
jgi:L-idonate 5-dehydrogenase